MSDHRPRPSESLSFDREEHVARQCLQFESAWRSGEQRSLEVFVDSSHDDDRFVLFRALLRIELQYRRLANESPSIAEYHQRFPNDLLAIEAAFRDAPTEAGRQIADSGGTTLERRSRLVGPDEDLPKIPGYQLLEALPTGGMGIVYRAREIDTDRIVALKMIRSGIHADPQELARFRVESEAIASLSHPHVIEIYHWGECDGLPYLVMEFATRGSLAQRLELGPLPTDEAAELLEKLALATHFIHERGIIHRDLKPANILIAQDGNPKLADFGLAKRLDHDQGLTQTQAVLGTASYMAPEQAAGNIHALSPAVDVYALGAILYEMLTGRAPFRGATREQTIHQVLHDDPRRPTQLRAEIPAELELICLKCLEKAPEARFVSARALEENVANVRRGVPLTVDGTTLLNRRVRAARRAGFEILDTLRDAAAATTLRARESSLGRIVVLEILGGGAHEDAPYRESLRAHAMAAANLHHANIVELYSFGELDGECFIAREFVDGESIRDGQNKSARVPKQIALDLESLARAVHYAHLRGIVHGNLEPGKIVRDGNGVCKIIGYGTGLSEKGQQSAVGPIGGEPSAIESSTERSGLAIDPSDDLFSLGAILYEMINGHPPSSSRSEDDLEQTRTLSFGVLGELRAICQKCLDPDRGQRYLNAAALAEDLRRARAGEILLIDDLDDWLQQKRWARRCGYKIVELLAQSETGFTYKAIQIASERRVVLKRISARYRFVQAAKEQFRFEARLLAGLRHPNIAALFDLGELNDLVYYAREYVEGRRLARLAEPRQSGDEATEKAQESEERRLASAAKLICTLACTIQYIHDQKKVHGSLNPDGVHVAPDGVPKITSFRRANRSSHNNNEAAVASDSGLSERFLAPEQLDGVRRRPERSVDVYALGAMLSLLVWGRAPSPGASMSTSNERPLLPVPGSRGNPLELTSFEAICRRSMATEPNLRFATAGALADELVGILG